MSAQGKVCQIKQKTKKRSPGKHDRMPQTNPTTRIREPKPATHETDFRPPKLGRKLVDRLSWRQDQEEKRLKQTTKRIETLQKYLSISNDVTDALEKLSEELFEEVLGVLETQLTVALQEVLDQPIEFRAKADFKRGSAVVDFLVERDGFEEDIQRGQGGSVQNILSVGLRMFALATLDESEHRRFLVLDEQDCWLRPELVPSLVNIVHRAARELDFQVIMISHHDASLFEKFADRIYRFTPDGSSVRVKQLNPPAIVTDDNVADRSAI